MKKIILSVTCLIVVLLFSACGTATNTVSNTETIIPTGKFYFHSKTCPHCAIVDDYISKENIKQKLYFISREIDVDAGAVSLLKAVGKKCTIPDNELGVPLFWDGSSCYTGDKEVINYFKSQTQ